MRSNALARAVFCGVVALVLLCVLWETVLAPLKPGGTWLAMKALPLALLILSTFRLRPKALQALTLLLPFYLAEGIVRGFSESGRHALVAWIAALLAALTYGAVLGLVRSRRRA